MDPFDDESGLFDETELAAVPDDLEIEVIEEWHSWRGSYGDGYQEDLDEYRERVRDAILEKERIYDVKLNTSIKDGGAMHEAWIFYAEEE